MWGDDLARMGRAGLLSLVAAALTVMTWTGVRTPIGAHVGGRAQLSVSDFRLVPVDGASTAEVVLVDYDSGRPAPGFHVEISGLASSGEQLPVTPMVDDEARGRYRATVPITPGSWMFTVRATGIPGGQEAIPVARNLTMTVSEEGKAVAPARRPGTRQAAGETESGSNLGLYLGMILAGLLAAGGTIALVGRRRARNFERHPEFG